MKRQVNKGKKEHKGMEKNRRFENNLNENYGLTLMTFNYNGVQFQIRTTTHFHDKSKERGIDLDTACGDIVALGKERLYNYAKARDDVAIIDTENNMTTIITFEGNQNPYVQVRIRTIIPKSKVWVKTGTKIYNLKDYKGGLKK